MATSNRAAPHIFLSFKTEDRAAAHRLKEALVAQGLPVWWQEDIQTGREWHGDIDLALAHAGCVVVLWSRLSMASRWVRHEASQAIARGIYAPARIEPIEIESPYNRIQATDLLNWSGDRNHPGFRNLLAFIDQLLPPPVPLARRAMLWLRRQAASLSIAVFAVLATALLLWLANKLTTQVAQQAQIAKSVERTLQPLESLQVSAIVALDPEMPGVRPYLKLLRDGLTVLGNSEAVIREPLPDGVRPSRTNAKGRIEAVSVEPGSPFWPAKDDNTWLDHVVKYVEVGLAFTSPFDAPAASNEKSRDARFASAQPDLEMKVGSYDPDGSENGRLSTSLVWDTVEDSLSVSFTDVPIPKWWRSSGRIVSVPDVELATLTVRFESVMVPSLEDVVSKKAVLDSRSYLKLNTLFLSYSGRQVMIRAAKMASITGENGLRLYSTPMNGPAVERETR